MELKVFILYSYGQHSRVAYYCVLSIMVTQINLPLKKKPRDSFSKLLLGKTSHSQWSEPKEKLVSANGNYFLSLISFLLEKNEAKIKQTLNNLFE